MFNQLTTFFIYMISGMAICIFYDVFRVLRKSMKTSNTVTYIEDAIFWIVVGLFLIWEIFKISYGELRSYIFIGLILGGAIYLLTFSKFFIKINVKIITYFKKIIFKIFNPIVRLVRKPIYFLCINIKKIYNNLLKSNIHPIPSKKINNHKSFHLISYVENRKSKSKKEKNNS